MSIEQVKAYFKQYNRDQDILEFTASSATVALAAQALGVEPARIAKTLAFRSAASCILVVTTGDSRIDNHKFKHYFGYKAKLLNPDETLALTGHAVGGVCPFGLNNPDIKTYIDHSIKRFTTIFPACGSSHSAIELSGDELYYYAQARDWIDVCSISH